MRIAIALAWLLAMAGFASSGAALTLGPGEPLTERLIEGLVDQALAAEVRGRIRIEIETPRLPLANQSSATTEIWLERLERNPRGARFDATLRGATDDGQSFVLALRGRAVELLEVPVVNRAIEPEELIGEGDLDWLEVAADRLPRGALLDPAEVIGLEARRRLVARRILTSRDLGRPLLVRRNQPVRLLYSLDGLTISTLGTAQDDGASGAVVRVVNLDSRRQVQGLVTGPDEVTVSTGQPLID